MSWAEADTIVEEISEKIDNMPSSKNMCWINVITTSQSYIGLTVRVENVDAPISAQTVLTDQGDGTGKGYVLVGYAGKYKVKALGPISDNHERIVEVKCLGDVVNVDLNPYYLYGYKKRKIEQNPAMCCEYTDMAVGFTKLTRDLTTDTTDMGDWEDTFVFKAFRPVFLGTEGEVLYELDHNDQRYRIDGVTPSDISDTSAQGDFMVGIKPIWVKRWEDEEYEYEQVCDIKLDEDFDTPNIGDDGQTVLDEIYRHAVKPSLVNGKVRSICGQQPYNNAPGATELANIQAKGAGYYFSDYGIEELFRTVLTLFSLNTNAQAVYGYGHCDGGTAASSLLTTGGLKDKGCFSGTNANTYMKALWCENLYGDRWDRDAGLLYINQKLYAKAHPPFNDTGNNYENLNITITGTSGGFISKTKMTKYGMMPVEVSGSATTFTCDGGWFATISGVFFLLAGGACCHGAHCGFARSVSIAFSNADWHIGPSLSYRKPVAA